MTYLPHILAGVAAFAAATLLTLWRIAQSEIDKLSDELTTAAELDRLQRAKIEKLESDIDMLVSQKNNANTRAAQCEAETIRIFEHIADLERIAPVRNAKGQYTRKSITPNK